jgi:hypothetical protein
VILAIPNRSAMRPPSTLASRWLVDVVRHHLEEEVVAEDVEQVADPLERAALVLAADALRELSAEAARHADQALVVEVDQLGVDARLVVEPAAVDSRSPSGRGSASPVVLGDERQVVVDVLPLFLPLDLTVRPIVASHPTRGMIPPSRHARMWWSEPARVHDSSRLGLRTQRPSPPRRAGTVEQAVLVVLVKSGYRDHQMTAIKTIGTQMIRPITTPTKRPSASSRYRQNFQS